MNEQNDEKLIDLLSQRAIYGLNVDETSELNQLFPQWKDDFSFDSAIAKLDLVNLDQSAELPSHLRTNILNSCEAYFVPDLQPTFELKPKSNWLGLLGWATAAACALLAFSIWTNRVEAPKIIVKAPTEALNNGQLRQRILDLDKNAVNINWAKGNVKNLPEVSGDLVWSDEKQAGYMRFRGLPINDTTKECYQLWIFDETQDEKTPVDGGIFDVKDDGEFLVSINAKLKIKNPKLFAITIEKPGGVVVSKREKIAVLAKTSA
jgi:Anti-sigma-K factor rskA